MQTIVKVFIALFFSHFTASEPIEEKKEKLNKDHASIVVKSTSCASLNSTLSDYLI